jgi:hypothetical protein
MSKFENCTGRTTRSPQNEVFAGFFVRFPPLVIVDPLLYLQNKCAKPIGCPYICNRSAS